MLVVQDYFTKWVEAIPNQQHNALITCEPVKIFAVLGMPKILHSDQGQNFESTILKQTLQAFGIVKSHMTAYHTQGDSMVEHFNRSRHTVVCQRPRKTCSTQVCYLQEPLSHRFQHLISL